MIKVDSTGGKQWGRIPSLCICAIVIVIQQVFSVFIYCCVKTAGKRISPCRNGPRVESAVNQCLWRGSERSTPAVESAGVKRKASLLPPIGLRGRRFTTSVIFHRVRPSRRGPRGRNAFRARQHPSCRPYPFIPFHTLLTL